MDLRSVILHIFPISYKWMVTPPLSASSQFPFICYGWQILLLRKVLEGHLLIALPATAYTKGPTSGHAQLHW